MFKKLVSSLPFSPTLVGQLGSYARKLQKEVVVRRLGLIVTVLALIVQSFAVFNPPQPANASNPNDIINGGVTTVEQVLEAYDKTDVGDLFRYQGITRDEITNVRSSTINVADNHEIIAYGRTPRISASQGEVAHSVPSDDGSSTTFYSRPMHNSRDNISELRVRVWQGYSANGGGDFWIVNEGGNLATRTPPSERPTGQIVANCTEISGSAVDTRNTAAKVRVQVFAGGPPGQGELIFNEIANKDGNRFSFAVPAKYQQSGTPVDIYGVMTPLAGWSTSTVDIGAAQIPSDCAPKQVAQCKSLAVAPISRTKFSLSGAAEFPNDTAISTYTYLVKDSAGTEVFRKTINSTDTVSSIEIELANEGAYTVQLIAATTAEDAASEQASIQCEQPITVVPPNACPLNPELAANDPGCATCPGDASIWRQDDDCAAKIAYGKTGVNITRNTDVTQTLARAGDSIEYTVSIENTGKASGTIDMIDNLDDALEYAELIDHGGGSFDAEKRTLTWGQIALQPGQRETRSFTMRIRSPVPATPVGQSEPMSYDCQITNTFGNTLNTDIDCPPVKAIESAIGILPRVSTGVNILVAGITLAVVIFFYARSRQLKKEVRLVRKNFNAGTL